LGAGRLAPKCLRAPCLHSVPDALSFSTNINPPSLSQSTVHQYRATATHINLSVNTSILPCSARRSDTIPPGSAQTPATLQQDTDPFPTRFCLSKTPSPSSHSSPRHQPPHPRPSTNLKRLSTIPPRTERTLSPLSPRLLSAALPHATSHEPPPARQAAVPLRERLVLAHTAAHGRHPPTATQRGEWCAL
jgi:hypothetical protein